MLPKPRGGTHRQTDTLLQVLDLDVGRAGIGQRALDRLAYGRHFGHGPHARRNAFHLLDAARHELRHLRHGAVMAVVEDEDFSHVGRCAGFVGII